MLFINMWGLPLGATLLLNKAITTILLNSLVIITLSIRGIA